MKTTITHSLVLLATLTTIAATADAQAQTSYSHRHHGHHNHIHGFTPAYDFGFGYGPATAAESFYRGYADLVRAYGENNYYNSMAQVNWEQAREKSIVNRTAKVEQFFALRKFNEDQRLGSIAKSRLSKEQLVAMSRKAAPKRLGEEHWDPATDGLAWPAALQQSEYDVSRTRLDELFRIRRDATGGLTGDEMAEVQQLTDEMTDGLKSMISEVKPTDYVAAKRFLSSVAHEVRQNTATGARLAQR